jgi:dolichyl-phosphate-mannose-protein mannosyltransferase
VNSRLAASLLVSALIGWLSIRCISWRPTGWSAFPLLTGFLALGIGLGVSSSFYFIWLSIAGLPRAVFPLAELGLLLLLLGIALYARRGRSRAPFAVRRESPTARVYRRALVIALAVGVGCTTFAFLVTSATTRNGGWDAWMTWNMHARAIFRGGDQWRAVLSGLPAWSHPDYPLLLPATVARMWTYAGGETVLAPASVAMLFTAATVGVLYSSVSILRSPAQGALAAVLLLATPFFVVHGASQYADVPLAFFFLATFVLLCLHEVWPDNAQRLLVLAGLTAGLAAWTKNEGLLFLLAVVAGHAFAVIRRRGWRAWCAEARAFATGLAPVVVLIVYFKVSLAPPNDLMSDQGFRQTAARLLDGTRYVQVLGGFKTGLSKLGDPGFVGPGWLLLAYLVCVGFSGAAAVRLGARTAAIAVSLMLAGYAAVLLTAPAPLLGTNIRSIDRLLLQLWPTVIFAYCLWVRSPEEVGDPAQRLSPA